MRIHTAAAATLALIATGLMSAMAADGSSTRVTSAWVRANPGGSTLTAAFMEIKSDTGDKLTAVSTPAAGRAEVHTHIMEGDVMKMRRLDVLEIPKGESKKLKPMGDHIMLFDLKQPLKPGDRVPLRMTFEKAGAVTVDATVEPVGSMGIGAGSAMPAESGASTEHQGH